MRFSRVGTCFVVAGIYLLVRVMPIALQKGFRSPLLAIALSMVLTAATMLAQLAYSVSVVRVRMKPSRAALLALGSGLIVAAALFATSRIEAHAGFLKTFSGMLTLASVNLGKDLFLILFATSLGYLISFIVREPNILLPAAFFAGIVDYWGVTRGPVAHMLDKAPDIVAKASVHMPKVIIHSAHMVVVIDSMIGMGDFLFFALFMGVLYRFDLNAKGAFWFGYALLTVSMLFVTFSGTGIAIPALVPMGIAILATNAKNFKLKHEELMAMLYVGIILLIGLIAAVFFMRGK